MERACHAIHETTTIQRGTFLNCSALETITVSDKIEYATKDAFYGCDALVYNEEGELRYLGNDDNKTVLLVSPKTLNVTDCEVSKTTKVIADATGIEAVISPTGIPTPCTPVQSYIADI